MSYAPDLARSRRCVARARLLVRMGRTRRRYNVGGPMSFALAREYMQAARLYRQRAAIERPELYQ